MDDNNLLDEVLTRAAERLGDVTQSAMNALELLCPGANEVFCRHADVNGLNRLQGSMVEQAFYCLMRLPQDPVEVEILLHSTVPNHLESLEIPEELLRGLFLALQEVIGATIAVEDKHHQAVWEAVNQRIQEIIGSSVRDYRALRNRISISA